MSTPKPPVPQAKAPAPQAKAPVPQAKAPVAQAKPPVPQTKPQVPQTKSPIPNVPALALIFNILGGLTLLGAVAAGVGVAMQYKSTSGGSVVALPVIGSAIFMGALFLGAAEVIQWIARIAAEACRSADAAERSAAAAELQGKSHLFLYQVGDEVRGPVSLEVLRSLRALKTGPRHVTGETIVCRVGDSEWKRLADIMDKPA